MFRESGLATSFVAISFMVAVAGCLVVSHGIALASGAEQVWDYSQLTPHDLGLGREAVYNLSVAPAISFVSPGIGEEWVEGTTVTITWQATGPIRWVRLYYYGGRCPLGGRSRGSFGAVIADNVPHTNSVQWTVPWIDATCFRLRIAGFDSSGQRLGDFERTVRFRPRELVGLPDTCIAIIKRKQRLYYYKDGQIVRMHLVSTAWRGYSTPIMKPGDYSSRRGAMGQVFRKSPGPRSHRYDVTMPYWLAITSTGSHGIHGTSPNLYYRLGRPASHGCIRQHRNDARILYELVPVGTPVYIF